MMSCGLSLAGFARFVHRNLLWLILLAYAFATAVPGPGLWLRSVHVGAIGWGDGRATVSLPALVLALLLFNAGYGVDVARLRHLVRSPGVLLVGLLANLLAPSLLLLGVSHTLRDWPDAAQARDLIVGLALVASLPVAGSSATWSQNANGDLALSLGLVVLSTCLSPLTTPLTLRLIALFGGADADALGALATGGTAGFLAVAVVLPSCAGIAARALCGREPSAATKAAVKLVNAASIVLLNYANGAAGLPRVLADGRWGFLAVATLAVTVMCLSLFALGWGLARLLGADGTRRAALAFGLGMSSNGPGLVLASAALAHLPGVLLPVILYNLVQHAIAGAVDGALKSGPARAPRQSPRLAAPAL